MEGSFYSLSPRIGVYSSHLPPKVTDNNYHFVESGLGPEDQIATNVALIYHQMVSGAKKTELFMGCPYRTGEDGFCDGPGTLELAPHNTLHAWVGSNLNPERENMGTFYSAVRDPIFYAHHSNIDRLWDVWKGLRGNKSSEIVDPDCLDSYFFFHNEKSQLVRIKVSDVLGVTKLKYTYQWVKNPWFNARPKPSVPLHIARHTLDMRDNNNQNGLPLSSNNITLDFGPKVDETKIGPESREFAGTFVYMPRGVRLVMNEGDTINVKRKTKLKLGISELLEDLEADGDENIWVTLVPRGGTGVNTTIDGFGLNTCNED
ncbi:Tyrosinase [Macleaya cordata]|uniref:Tyrosinase n=1 Tax=Macleaya cordata TaxID=56857 RepID=A0A200Q9C8_MACCD|nr:Tyrosinase [Macleaya cordata]